MYVQVGLQTVMTTVIICISRHATDHDAKRPPKTVQDRSHFRGTFGEGFMNVCRPPDSNVNLNFQDALSLLRINVQCRQAVCRSIIQLNMTPIATRNVPLKQFQTEAVLRGRFEKVCRLQFGTLAFMRGVLSQCTRPSFRQPCQRL